MPDAVSSAPQSKKSTNLMDNVLEEPSYGWRDKEDQLVTPTSRQILKEFFFRLNIGRSKKNWVPFLGWLKLTLLLPCEGVGVQVATATAVFSRYSNG